MRAARTRLARFATVVIMAAGLGVGVAVSASAHDVLISSNPVEGATLHAVPSTVSFTFDQPAQDFDPVVSLIGPDGKQYATGTPQVSGNVVTGNVEPVPAGAYIAAFRVVSADGHPVTGEVHFTLAAGATPAGANATAATGAGSPATTGGPAGTGSPAGAGSGQAAVTSTPNNAAPAVTSGGLSAAIWIVLIVAALVITAAAVILLRRPPGRRSANRSGADKDY